MILYPAIDLMDGCCVRLRQGRFDEPTRYSAYPAEALRQFEEEGAEWAHIVDLDGVRAGSPRQHELIAGLIDAAELKLQVASAIRDARQVEHLLGEGIDRVVIGSLAVTEPERVREILDRFGPDRIALALDVMILEEVPMVAASGWAEASDRTLWDVASRFPDVRHLLVTDIRRDGMASGPNLALIEDLATRFPTVDIQASGGISSLGDIERLTASGAAGAVVGEALWEKKFTLADALSLARA